MTATGTARTILHLDMDAFYAAVEQRDRPELRGKPVIVGADPRGGLGRGVVSTASYEARRFGVGSAMPISKAYQLCPHGIYVPVDMARYVAVSEEVMAVLRGVTDCVEPLSIDEAFLDVAGARRRLGDGVAAGEHLRARVRSEVGLAISVGVATTKFLAKVASDRAKPDGLKAIPPGGELDFLHPLPVRVLWGVGPKTAEKLERLGVRTVGDVARLPVGSLVAALGTAVGQHLCDLANNRDPRPVVTDRHAKSIGHEETFADDLTARADIERELLRLTDSVASRLRAAHVRARTITLKARYRDFATITRAHTLDQPTDSAHAIMLAVRALLDHVDCARGLRLVGVHASNLVGDDVGVQGTLALDDSQRPTPTDARRADIERSLDDVRRRFGSGSVRAAALLVQPERPNPAMPTLPHDHSTSEQRGPTGGSR